MTAIRLPDLTDPDHSADAVVGEWVLVLMRRQHLTQKVMAEHLGITQAAYGRKLSGRRPWQLSELQRVASVLGTDVATLVSGLPRLDSNQQPSGYLSLLVSEPQLATVLPFRRAA